MVSVSSNGIEALGLPEGFWNSVEGYPDNRFPEGVTGMSHRCSYATVRKSRNGIRSWGIQKWNRDWNWHSGSPQPSRGVNMVRSNATL
jgi:hypothetical protein